MHALQDDIAVTIIALLYIALDVKAYLAAA